MSADIIQILQQKAIEIRLDVVRSLEAAGSGHIGGSLGLADVFSTLYFYAMNHAPTEPNWPDRDRLILSIGHVAPVYYAALANAGYFPKEELLTLRKFGSRLQGHPGKDTKLPGLESSSGSLGQGLSIAVGLALAAKTDNKNWRVFSVHGDGEIQEGSIWEAAMSAAHYKLDNMVAIVDRNDCQIDGRTNEVMNLEPLKDKWQAFGWEVIECNGNHIPDLIRAFDLTKKQAEKPFVIIAKTLMGKGVKSIEDNYKWHGKAPSKEEAEEFVRQIMNSN